MTAEPMIALTLDKSEWGDGPWQSEPDSEFWIDMASGFPGFARRSEAFGCWCGYLGLPPKHPWFSLAVEHIPLLAPNEISASGYAPIERGTKPVYRWLGFHCGHAGDYTPAIWPTLDHFLSPSLRLDAEVRGEYRDLEWVKSGVTIMALQAHHLDEWQEIRHRLIVAGLWIDVEGTHG